MITEFKRLTDQETELLMKAPILVCILIAGADGTIDRKEIQEAIRYAEKKHKRTTTAVAQVFKDLATDFEDKFKIILQAYPYESTQRSPLLVEELSGLNALWSKVDEAFAKEFYTTLKEIAAHIASSSGGILGYNSVGSEEAQYIELSMIENPAKN